MQCCGTATFLGGSGSRQKKGGSPGGSVSVNTNICQFELWKRLWTKKNFLKSYFAWTRLFLFAILKNPKTGAGSRSALTDQIGRLRSRPKYGGSGSATVYKSIKTFSLLTWRRRPVPRPSVAAGRWGWLGLHRRRRRENHQPVHHQAGSAGTNKTKRELVLWSLSKLERLLFMRPAPVPASVLNLNRKCLHKFK